MFYVLGILSSIFLIINYTQLPTSSVSSFSQLLGRANMATAYLFLLATWFFLIEIVIYHYFTVSQSVFVGTLVALYASAMLFAFTNLYISATFRKLSKRHEEEERRKAA